MRLNITSLISVAALLTLCAMTTGCAPKGTQVVLLPDHNNHVGRVALINAHGTTTIDKAGYSATLDRNSAPENPVPLEDREVQAQFGTVLSVEPEPPKKFILHFKSGADTLTERSAPLIQQIVETIHKRASRDISVAGHCDRVGDEKSNIALSLKRAEKVSSMLETEGVEMKFIRTSSHGEGNPLIPTPDNVPEPRNRRVEVIVR